MRSRHLSRSERGAVFIQIGMLLFALMALTVFVADYGMLWTARGQVQAAADAAALAGASARAYDWRVSGDAGVQSVATAIANLNLIWKAAGSNIVSVVDCPSGVSNCVTVDVYRDGTNGSGVLPQFLAPMFGVVSHGVRARATAIVGPANMTTCLKPWALPDEWREFGSGGELGEMDSATNFHAWNAGGIAAPNADTYTPPNGAQATTATNFTTDYGDIVQFNLDYPLTNSIVRGFMVPLVLPGSKTHRDNMTSCNGEPVTIGDTIDIDIDPALPAGEAMAAARDNYSRDTTADWTVDGGGPGYVETSCAPSCGAQYQSQSPRTWAIALFDPSQFEYNRSKNWAACPHAPTPCVTVVNIVGFFIDYIEMSGFNGRHGHYVRYPGMVNAAQPTSIVENGSWLVQPRLIR